VFYYLVSAKPTHTALAAKEKTWQVRVQSLQAGTRAPQIEIRGTVVAPNRYQAAAPGVGWVEAVDIREGDQVNAGAVLVTLDPSDFTTAVTQYEAELAEIKAQFVEADISHQQNKRALADEKSLLALRQKGLARSSQLKSRSLGSESALDDAQRSLKKQQLAVNQRELAVKTHPAKTQQLAARQKRAGAQLKKAQRALDRSRVLAPTAGVITSVPVSVGDRVNAGQALVSMYALDQLEVRALIPAIYLREIQQALQTGNHPTAIDPVSGIAFTLSRLAGEAKPGGVDGFLQAESDQPGLSPGQLVSLKLQRPAQPGLYAVPAIAIYDNTRLYLLEDGRLLGTEIEIIGQTNNAQGEPVQLVRGKQLKDGATLVLTRLPNATSGLKAEALAANSQ